MRDVLELTDGELRLWPVTLYGSLEELSEHGMVRALDAPPSGAEEESGGHKRWFRITAAGRRALTAESARLQAVAQLARQRLAHGGESA